MYYSIGLVFTSAIIISLATIIIICLVLQQRLKTQLKLVHDQASPVAAVYEEVHNMIPQQSEVVFDDIDKNVAYSLN